VKRWASSYADGSTTRWCSSLRKRAKAWTASAAVVRALAQDDCARCTLPPHLAIDRLFSVKRGWNGVTGTLVRGSISVGDPLFVVGTGGSQATSARGLHVHDHLVLRAEAPTRLAINLSAWLCRMLREAKVVTRDAHVATTSCFDASLELLRPTRSGVIVDVYVGTARSPGKLQLLKRSPSAEAKDPAPDGADAEPAVVFGRVRLDTPLVVLAGDRFVLRTSSAKGPTGAVLGGGRALDTRPPKDAWSRAASRGSRESLRQEPGRGGPSARQRDRTPTSLESRSRDAFFDRRDGAGSRGRKNGGSRRSRFERKVMATSIARRWSRWGLARGAPSAVPCRPSSRPRSRTRDTASKARVTGRAAAADEAVRTRRPPRRRRSKQSWSKATSHGLPAFSRALQARTEVRSTKLRSLYVKLALKGLGEFASESYATLQKKRARSSQSSLATAWRSRQAVNGSIGRAWMRFAKRSSPIFTQNRSSPSARAERSLRSRTQASHPASRAVRSRRDHDSKRRRPFSRAQRRRLAPDSTTRLFVRFSKRRGLDTLYSPPPRAQIRRSVAVIARLGCDDVDRRDGRLGR